jgi:DNA-binding HxlR family transcriptional regulator
MSEFVEDTLGPLGYGILQNLQREDAGFNNLLKKHRVNNRTLRRELEALVKEDYIKKLSRKERLERHDQCRGRPVEPYVLAEKGIEYLKVEKELREIRSNLYENLAAGKITLQQWSQIRKDRYKRVGAAYPTPQEWQRRAFEQFSEWVKNLGPNKILLIETDQERRIRGSYFEKPDFVVKKKSKGFRRIVIELGKKPTS